MSKILKRLASDRLARCELVCFPYAGAGPSVFRAWPEHLSPLVNISAVHLPGREERITDPPDLNFERVVNEVIEAVAPLANRPIILFGHSFGATLAAHVAQEILGSRNERDAILFVAARLPPWTSGISAESNYLNSPLTADDPRLAKMTQPAVAADQALAESARGLRECAITFPVIALWGDADIANPMLKMREWSRFTSGAFQSVAISGGHFFIRSQAERIARMVDNSARQLAEGGW
jgi:medium-chain acyl-[acyl-carrier-protein] hydrolase